jgi:uncharacterized membrane protein YcaP (DUF421 family)
MTLLDIGLISLKTIGCYFFLILILRIMGKREMSQVSTHDIVVFLIISELFSLSLNDSSQSILKSIIPIGIIVIFQILTAFISLKSRKFRILMEGSPTFLIINGNININELKRQRYNIDDLMSQLHQNNIQSPLEVSFAFIEDNGTLCIIKKNDQIVKNPEVLIIDGEFNEDYIKKYNIDISKIREILLKRGYQSEKEIFFGQELINDLYLVPFEKKD